MWVPSGEGEGRNQKRGREAKEVQWRGKLKRGTRVGGVKERKRKGREGAEEEGNWGRKGERQ